MKKENNRIYEKAVVPSIIAIFIGSAFVPAVGCQFISMFDSTAQSFWTYTGSSGSDFVISRGMGLMLYTTTSSIWHGEG